MKPYPGISVIGTLVIIFSPLLVAVHLLALMFGVVLLAGRRNRKP